MLCRDASPLQGIRLTAAGYLAADVRMARVGLYDYQGREVGRPDLASVKVYRPVSEVFRSKAAASFAHAPVTIDHPSEGVSAASWKRDAVGYVADEIRRDGDFLRASILITDAAAVAKVQAGTVELSCGYNCELDWTSGTTESGQRYDVVQRGIVGNHVAIVERGRAGPDCRIGGA